MIVVSERGRARPPPFSSFVSVFFFFSFSFFLYKWAPFVPFVPHFLFRQIYTRGLLLKIIYGGGFLLKQITEGVISGRGCRHWHWREAWTARNNGEIGGAAIGICGTGWGEREYRQQQWRDGLTRREVGSPATPFCGTHSAACNPLL